MSAQILAVPITLVVVALIAASVWYPIKHPDSAFVQAVGRAADSVARLIEWVASKGAYIGAAVIVGFGVVLLWTLIAVALESLGVGR